MDAAADAAIMITALVLADIFTPVAEALSALDRRFKRATKPAARPGRRRIRRGSAAPR
jgi:hypothetical protein